MVWLNIDFPVKKCTLHTDSDCTYWQKKKETPYKGLGSLKRDGGWLSFSSAEHAQLYQQTSYPEYDFIGHC